MLVLYIQVSTLRECVHGSDLEDFILLSDSGCPLSFEYSTIRVKKVTIIGGTKIIVWLILIIFHIAIHVFQY